VIVGMRGLRFDLLVVDGVVYEEVVTGTSGDPHLPHELLDPGSPPIPVIVSPELAGGADAITPGETFSLPLEAHQFPARALVVREFVPILPIGGQWAFVSRDQLQALQPTTRLLPTTVFLRAPGATAESIRAALAVAVPGATLDSQAERVAAIRGSPTVGAVRTGIAAAGIVAGAYAALAVAAALALAGAARAIEVAHLRLLGLTRRQAIGLAVVEHGPTVVVALAAGVALGLGLFIVLRPGLGLADLLGSPIEISLAVDATQLGLVLAAILLLAAAGIGIGAAIQRTIAPAAALRRGFD